MVLWGVNPVKTGYAIWTILIWALISQVICHFDGIAQVVDYIIYMTYDLHGQWDYNNKFVK